jgi:hypothetical protein
MKRNKYRKQSRRNQKGGGWLGFSHSQSPSPSQQTQSSPPPHIKTPSSNSTILSESSPYNLQAIKATLDSLTKKVDKLADGITQICGQKPQSSPNAPTFEELTARAAELGINAKVETPTLSNITGTISNTNALAARFKALGNMKRT